MFGGTSSPEADFRILASIGEIDPADWHRALQTSAAGCTGVVRRHAAGPGGCRRCGQEGARWEAPARLPHL